MESTAIPIIVALGARHVLTVSNESSLHWRLQFDYALLAVAVRLVIAQNFYIYLLFSEFAQLILVKFPFITLNLYD